MAFESQKGNGEIWNPTKDAEGDPRTEATKDDYLDGHFVDQKNDQGEHNSTIYTILKPDGEKVNVWGTKVLNDQMTNIRKGAYIRIQWLGKKPTKAGALKKEKQRLSTDSFHDWEVFVDNDVKPVAVQQSLGEQTFNGSGTGAAKKETPGAGNAKTATSSGRPDLSGEVEDDLPF